MINICVNDKQILKLDLRRNSSVLHLFGFFCSKREILLKDFTRLLEDEVASLNDSIDCLEHYRLLCLLLNLAKHWQSHIAAWYTLVLTH